MLITLRAAAIYCANKVRGYIINMFDVSLRQYIRAFFPKYTEVAA